MNVAKRVLFLDTPGMTELVPGREVQFDSTSGSLYFPEWLTHWVSFPETLHVSVSSLQYCFQPFAGSPDSFLLTTHASFPE
jgi:hypothetical protein